jgi:hypothetical protein
MFWFGAGVVWGTYPFIYKFLVGTQISSVEDVP